MLLAIGVRCRLWLTKLCGSRALLYLALLFLFEVGYGVSGSQADSHFAPAIKVFVYNYAHVSQRNLNAAELLANKILAKAGVQAIWFDCLRDDSSGELKKLCENSERRRTPELALFAGHITDQYKDYEFGFANIPFNAVVSYEHVVRRAERDDEPSEIPVLLGAVIAHELGHLLLGDPTHSRLGIMRAQWGADQIHQAWCGRLWFTPEQALRMQAKVRRLIQSDEPQ